MYKNFYKIHITNIFILHLQAKSRNNLEIVLSLIGTAGPKEIYFVRKTSTHVCVIEEKTKEIHRIKT